MRPIVALVVLSLIAACDPAGRACTSSADCGSGYSCRYDWPSGDDPFVCQHSGVCIRQTDCVTEPERVTAMYPFCRPTDCPVSTIDEGGSVLGCDGVDYSFRVCPLVPILCADRACSSCYSGPLATQPVHPGPRASTEFCQANDRTIGWLPSYCCDCAFAEAGEATHYPDGCYHCFSAAAPDPTGACAPPDGYATHARWCCPISLPAGDAGTDAS